MCILLLAEHFIVPYLIQFPFIRNSSINSSCGFFFRCRFLAFFGFCTLFFFVGWLRWLFALFSVLFLEDFSKIVFRYLDGLSFTLFYSFSPIQFFAHSFRIRLLAQCSCVFVCSVAILFSSDFLTMPWYF